MSLVGGTNALLAPQIDYIQNILLPLLKRHFLPNGVSSGLSMDLNRRGFFPLGGGCYTWVSEGRTPSSSYSG